MLLLNGFIKSSCIISLYLKHNDKLMPFFKGAVLDLTLYNNAMKNVLHFKPLELTNEIESAKFPAAKF